jgi:hypothetical protein
MSRLRRADHPDLTDEQFARTDAMLERFICQNIDWLGRCAAISQEQVTSMVDTYEDLALRQAGHNQPGPLYFIAAKAA